MSAEGGGRGLASRLWWDGDIVATSSVGVLPIDRTVLYGLGAFETVRLWDGRPFLLDRHLARLGRSLDALGLPWPRALDAAPAGVLALAEAQEARAAICRVTVTAGPAGGGRDDMHAFAMLRACPPPTTGIRVRVGSVTAPGSPLDGVKSTSYLTHYLLRERAEAEGRYDDLMLDARGNVSEATTANLFVVRAGTLLTPPVSDGPLAGVTRGLVLELAEEIGVRASERSLTLEDVRRADEVFLTGAGRGVVGVDEVVGSEMPDGRPVTARVVAALAARIAAECRVPVETIAF